MFVYYYKIIFLKTQRNFLKYLKSPYHEKNKTKKNTMADDDFLVILGRTQISLKIQTMLLF